MGSWLEFLWGSLLFPSLFFVTFRMYGTKPAIALGITVALAQVLVLRLKRLPLSPFLLISAGFTLVFGLGDLVMSSPRLFRLQPFAQNALLGTVFVATLALRVPLVEWLARSLPENIRPDLSRPESRAYLRKVTWLWVGYFYAKALLFLWASYRMDLAELVAFRSIVGGSSMALMLAGEIAYRKLKARDPLTPRPTRARSRKR